MAKETEWKTIPSFPEYEASSDGDVRMKGGYKDSLTPHRYRGDRNARVSVRRDGKQYVVRINILVSEAFLGEMPKGYEILYRDGNVANNSADNIYYGKLEYSLAQEFLDKGFRWVVGYEGLYVVSRSAEIWSIGRRAGPRIIKSQRLIEAKIRGYQTVTLTRDGNSKRVQVHRIVATAFLDNPLGLPCINHKDENKLNNNADNLEWCTYAYNNAYGTRNERAAKANSFPILVYNPDGSLYGGFESCSDAAKHFGTHSGSICRWARGRKRKDGLIFKYKYNGGKQKPRTLQ